MHDVGYDQGISHQLVADLGYGIPGTVLVCSDSHTCSAGVFNCLARGVGGPDVFYAAVKGETWFRCGETIRYELTGRLPKAVTTKDAFLQIADVMRQLGQAIGELGMLVGMKMFGLLGNHRMGDHQLADHVDQLVDAVEIDTDRTHGLGLSASCCAASRSASFCRSSAMRARSVARSSKSPSPRANSSSSAGRRFSLTSLTRMRRRRVASLSGSGCSAAATWVRPSSASSTPRAT